MEGRPKPKPRTRIQEHRGEEKHQYEMDHRREDMPRYYEEEYNPHPYQSQSSIDSDTDIYGAEDEEIHINKSHRQTPETLRDSRESSRYDHRLHSESGSRRNQYTHEVEQNPQAKEESYRYHSERNSGRESPIYRHERETRGYRRRYEDDTRLYEHREPHSERMEDNRKDDQKRYQGWPEKEEMSRRSRSPRPTQARSDAPSRPPRYSLRGKDEDHVSPPSSANYSKHNQQTSEKRRMREQDTNDFDYEQERPLVNPEVSRMRYRQDRSPHYQPDQRGHSGAQQDRGQKSSQFYEERESDRMHRRGEEQRGWVSREGRHSEHFRTRRQDDSELWRDDKRRAYSESEAQKRYDQHEQVIKTTIEVSGYNPRMPVSDIQDYFISNVGDIIELTSRQRSVLITFGHPSAEEKVLSKKHILRGLTVKIKVIDRTRIRLNNVPEDVSHKKLTRFVRGMADVGRDPDVVYSEDPGTAMVSFEEEIDLEAVLIAFTDTKFGQYYLSAAPLQKPDAILVTGILPNISSQHMEDYFSDKSMDILVDVEMGKKATAVVKFRDFQDVERLHVLSICHKLHGNVIQVVAYYDFLGEAASTEGPPLTVPEPLEFTKQSLITIRPLKLTPSNMKQLSCCGIHEQLQTQFKDVHMELSPDTLEVIFKASKDDVSEAMVKMFEMLNSLEKTSFTPPAGVHKFLSNKVDIIQGIFGSKQIPVACEFEESSVVVCGLTSKDITTALEYLQTEIVSRSVPLTNKDLLSTFQSDLGQTLLASLTDDNSLDVTVNAIDLCVNVTGFVEFVNEACKKIGKFMIENTIITKFIPVDKGKLEYIMKFLGRELETFAGTNQHHSLTIVPKPGKQPGIALSGTEEGVKLACTMLNTWLDKIVDRQYPIAKPGVSELFKDSKAKLILGSVSQDLDCVIIVVENQEEPPLPPKRVHPIPKKRVHPPPKRAHMKDFICRCSTRDGQILVVRKGDITAENVDAIVNAANPKLEHQKGLSAAIVKNGGQVIQTESFEALKQKGRDLRTTEVVHTSGGNLQCKYVIHVAGPQWRGGTIKGIKGFTKEENLLYESINNILEEALKLGIRSLALSAISSGNLGFPVDRCTGTILEAATNFCQIHKYDCTLKEISFTNIDQQACDAFVKAMSDKFGTQAVEYPKDVGQQKESTDDESLYMDMSQMSPKAAKPTRSKPPLPSRFKSTASDDTIETRERKYVTLKKGSLAKESVDIIVNTTGSKMILTDAGGVSKALLLEAGPDLQKQVDRVLGKRSTHVIASGEFIVTGPSTLKCKQIYHSVCPEYKDPIQAEKILRMLLHDMFVKADQSGMVSIALPAFGTGNLNFPRDVTARIMFQEVFFFSLQNPGSPLQYFRFIVYDQATIQAFEAEKQRLCTTSSTTLDQDVCSNLQNLSGGVTQMTMGLVKVQLQKGNVTRENTDAIVNSTGQNLRLDGAVSLAILKDGGSLISDECDNIRKGGPVPDIVKTGAGRLSCNAIIHAFLRNFDRLKETTLKVLKFAEDKGLRSIAIPAIGTGKVGGNVAKAAADILDAIAEFGMNENPKSLLLVKLSIFQDSMVPVFRDVMAAKVGRSFVHRKGYVTRGVAAVKKGLSSSAARAASAVIGKAASPAASSPVEEDDSKETIIFHIIAADKRDLDKAIETIEDFTKKEITKAIIPYNSKEMGDLDDMKISGIKAIGKKHKLRMILIPSDVPTQFVIEGQKLTVETAKAEIQEFFTKLQTQKAKHTREMLYNETVQWMWFNADLNVFEEYDKTVNPLIESAYVDKEQAVELDLEDGKVVIDFDEMLEIDPTGKQPSIEVKRVDLKKDGNFDLPYHWIPMKDNEHHMLVPLQPVSSEYQNVEATIRSSMAKDSKLGNAYQPKSIVKIERVQNKKLYRMYVAFRGEMKSKLHNIPNCERTLFHGTSEATCEQINRGGFNRSYTFKPSHGTVYGKGTYFATHASSSVTYTVEENGLRRIYLCKVMVGEYSVGTENMFVPPMKPTSLDKFDSLVDDVKDPQIFVAFQDAQAYPEYLMTFK